MMLRQLSYAIKNQLVAKIPPTRGISCSSLVLYGMSQVASMHRKVLLGVDHALKGPIIGTNENAGYISEYFYSESGNVALITVF